MSTVVVKPCALPDTPLADAATGLDACVHCGFCLQACPTYVNLQDENDSPRGRIVLMRRLLEGELALDDVDVGTHIDRCLGCRACETACPSGVPFGHLLEATRATTAAARKQPLVGKLILALFARRRLLGVALAGARVFRATRLPALFAKILPRRLAFPMAMLASTTPVKFVRPQNSRAARKTLDVSTGLGVAIAARYSAALAQARFTEQENTVALLEGCVMRGLFSHTNSATQSVLGLNGYRILTAPSQACCGALHAHAGNLETARSLARINIAAFEKGGADFIAINSAGCGAMVKEYAHLLKDDAHWRERAAAVAGKARDISELLAARGPVAGAELAARVTYDAPCHLMHAQRITREPIAVLQSIPQLALIPLADVDQCCGSAGIYNLIEPDTSDAVLAPKLARINETGAQFVATGNPGCLMQIGAGLRLQGSTMRAVHPVDLLHASYQNLDP
ncbi:MAG: heterodisulfide reductase-related iron-sulfur binding cluster [Gemmatimonadota bacterium]|nr:heterodisulfide reductase-related iron-sulfur binding cluster [Gemmatimonadota bacterium]